MASKIEQLLSEINKLSVLELAEMTKALEEAWGVSGAMAVAAAPATGTAASQEAAPKAQEKSEYKVVLSEAGANKINVIKALRAVKPSMGLGDVKKAVDEAPYTIEEAASKEDAKKIKEALEAAGAKVELS